MAKANELNAINTFFFHAMNFPSCAYTNRFTGTDMIVPEFIVKSKWTCDVEHMIGKWSTAFRKAGSYGAMFAFYAELDNTNRIALIDWVLENWHDCRDLA